MLIRNTVAALDFNSNVNRKTKVSADGQLMYKLKVNNEMLTITILDPRIKLHDNQKQNLAS